MLNFFYCKINTAKMRKQQNSIICTDGTISIAYTDKKITGDILIFCSLLFYFTFFYNFVRIIFN